MSCSSVTNQNNMGHFLYIQLFHCKYIISSSPITRILINRFLPCPKKKFGSLPKNKKKRVGYHSATLLCKVMSSIVPQIKKIKLDNSPMAATTTDLDLKALNKFSRQNAALGAETTAKLIKMKLFISGLRGLGMETAKNLALQGAGAITLADSAIIEAKDVGVNFFFRSEDVGKVRSQVVAPRLRELNPLCTVSIIPTLTDSAILGHSAVVITTPIPLSDLIQINELCRKHGIPFFYAFAGGLSADVFVDHGPNHVLLDPNGEKPIQKLITSITPLNAEECLVRYETPEGQMAEAISSGFFEISEVIGIPEINSAVYPISHDYKEPVKTVRIPFKLPSERYVSGGILTEKKIPVKYPMKSLKEMLRNPGELVSTDLLAFSEYQQHLAFFATLTFAEKHGRLPAANSVDDSAAVFQVAEELLSKKELDVAGLTADEAFIKQYAAHASVELQPIAAFIGGVLAQEVVKCAGKFTPIPGFLHFSALEALPSEEDKSGQDFAPRGSANDELAAVYGWGFVEKLSNLKYFMVGCGALGCEFMKNFALNGICCGPEGKLFVTDADRIELSNLSRQFLFREHNVGQPKSRAAAAMAQIMNPQFNVEALELYVGTKSEDVFTDEFWGRLDGVCNALDNMEARIYVDIQCVKYEKPLLESGTMGTSGNVDTICPFKTRTYRDGGDAAEGGGVPMCTLRNFPHLTEHCIEWARDQFELLFVKLGASCKACLTSVSDSGGLSSFEEKIKEKAASEAGAAFFDIRSVTSLAKVAAAPSIGGAAQLAFDLFHYLFRDRILDLQAAFPVDSRMIDRKTGADKGPFWGEKKRYPTVMEFNPDDESHTNFVLSATCLFAVMIGLIPPKKEDDDQWLKDYRSKDFIVNIISGLTVPPYVRAPVSAEGMAEDETGPKQIAKNELDETLTSLFSDLRATVDLYQQRSAATGSVFQPEVADFEKDDDLNFHISFVTSCANLRCDNYSLKRTDFHSCKVIAGKIIAAIATTTAAVCGLVILELFKLVLQKDTDAYMNRQIALAVNRYTSYTQEKPISYETKTEITPPNPNDPLPEGAYDVTGKVKPEYMNSVVLRAYPEKHSVWHKLSFPAALSLKEFALALAEQHNLQLVAWNFIYGYKTIIDEESKKKVLRGVSASVFPPKPVLDYSLLPPLDLTTAQATTILMKTSNAKPVQQYLSLWRECKASGTLPPPPVSGQNSDVITETTTIYEILERMAKIGAEEEEQKKIDFAASRPLSGRQFVLLSSSEVPSCRDIVTGEDIEHLAAFKFIL